MRSDRPDRAALLVFVQGGLSAWSDAQRGWATARPAVRALDALLGGDAGEALGEDSGLALDGSLVLEDVVVEHATPDGPRRALDHLTLRVPAGQRVAIAGPSGAGKFLFRTTVRENVRMGRPDATDAAVERACARAGLGPLLLKLPSGLDTAIDERGLNLSGGERQRLALARLFVRDPKILVLDEPTSALDVETERTILPELEALFEGRTVLVVTHRPLLADRADRVLVIADGRVVEDGPPASVRFLHPL